MKIRIEDAFEDVLGKAARGLGLSAPQLAQRSGLALSAIQQLLSGELNSVDLRLLAPVLGLDPDKLLAMTVGEWQPAAVSLEGLRLYNTPFPVPGYQEMTVNNYMVYDRSSSAAVVFDSGSDPDALLSDLRDEEFQLQALFLTHTHRDHIAAYQRIVETSQCALYTPALEPLADAEPVSPGDCFAFGGLHIEARQTAGHSLGGTTYLVDGLAKRVAVVGDAIFCLSMGKAHDAYQQALQQNREQILSLPTATILCPGHGPMTTVRQELAHNPFF